MIQRKGDGGRKSMRRKSENQDTGTRGEILSSRTAICVKRSAFQCSRAGAFLIYRDGGDERDGETKAEHSLPRLPISSSLSPLSLLIMVVAVFICEAISRFAFGIASAFAEVWTGEVEAWSGLAMTLKVIASRLFGEAISGVAVGIASTDALRPMVDKSASGTAPQ